ncbi:hypothetical protein HMPREF3187_00434 [Aerococcus christensenii]|uniref:Uncharacterized protein n=1 Tax=Aerococcus christensenii TaxID=87541 RepID=A0A133Y3D5_9LACT|nr:hypothetical protein HMPREF3187_00434 [Aerococcus christensenii]
MALALFYFLVRKSLVKESDVSIFRLKDERLKMKEGGIEC